MLPKCKNCKNKLKKENLYYLKGKYRVIHLVGICDCSPNLQYFPFLKGLEIPLKTT